MGSFEIKWHIDLHTYEIAGASEFGIRNDEDRYHPFLTYAYTFTSKWVEKGRTLIINYGRAKANIIEIKLPEKIYKQRCKARKELRSPTVLNIKPNKIKNFAEYHNSNCWIAIKDAEIFMIEDCNHIFRGIEVLKYRNKVEKKLMKIGDAYPARYNSETKVLTVLTDDVNVVNTLNRKIKLSSFL